MKNFSVALLTCLLFTCSLLWAQDFRRWEPADGVAVRQGHHVEWYRSSAYQSEGEFAGEAAVAWSDTRQGERNIFLQVYDAEGEPRFLENGLQITSSPVRQENPIVVSCVDGGWFVTWERIVPEMQGQLLSDIYCTKVNSNGDILWGEPGIGVPVCVFQGIQENSSIIDDGNGGCLIAWRDQRGGDAGNIYGMHIQPNGEPDPDWVENGAFIVEEVGRQNRHKALSDDDGGMILVWEDDRRQGNKDIYAQRVTPAGEPLWDDGVIICDNIFSQESPRLCSDGNGGAFIAWVDGRNVGRHISRNIYVQRINENGESLWGEAGEGVAIMAAAWEQTNFRIISSEPGSAIISWEDDRIDSPSTDIFATRISGEDELIFEWDEEDGIPISIENWNQSRHRSCPDGSGGAYIIWEDERDEGFPETDIYMQGVTVDGQLFWDEDLNVVSSSYYQGSPVVLPNSDERVFVFWSDLMTGSGEIRGQMITNARELHWDEAGEIVATGISGNALNPQIHSRGDGTFATVWLDSRYGWRGNTPFIQICENHEESPDFLFENHGVPLQSNEVVGGGIDIQSTLSSDDAIIVVWEDHRRGQSYSIYAQKISWDGEILWEEVGVQCAELEFEQRHPLICSDGAGGAIIAWHYPTGDDFYDIYMQRLDDAGNKLWGDAGCQITDDEFDGTVESITSDGENGAVVVWRKEDEAGNTDLWIQRVDGNHELVWDENRPICEENGNQRRSDIKRHEEGYLVVWEDYRVENESFIFGQFINNDGSDRWDRFRGGYPICDGDFNPMNPKVECSEDGDIWFAWEDYRAGNRDIYLQKFSSETDDRGDPVILFREDNQPIYDGIPICAEERYQMHPEILSDGNNGLWLTWEDNRGDALSRADLYATHLTSEGVPVEGWEENGALVSGAIHNQKHLQMELIQVFGAEGIAVVWEDQRSTGKEEISNIYLQALNDEMVSAPEEIVVLPFEFRLYEPYPNPFNSFTRLGYQLPTSTDLSIRVFDISGREVASLVDGTQSAAGYSIVWDASSLTAGLYFVKMECVEFSSVRKVVLVK